jgi:hypothetical protein
MFAPHALRAGVDIFDDVLKGKSFKDSAFQRVLDTISKIVFNKNNQSGSGMRRKQTNRRKKSVKRVKRDIFT